MNYPRENFQESDQLQAVGEVGLQVVDGGRGLAEVLVDPPGEGVLLDPLPLRILGKIPLSISHGFLVPVFLLVKFLLLEIFLSQTAADRARC